MRANQILIPTTKETPSDAEIISHQLMLRAGLIRKLASGLYSWLPLGLRVLRRVETIVRQEMHRAGAQEVLMPAIQPSELWQNSGRWEQYGPELLRLKDRHQREFCFGPTHEEVITDLVRREIRSHKQLPATFFQIQTKFRDEIRPRFGVMRAREFIMKDAYSFHVDEKSLAETYDTMFKTYCRIFERMGLNYRPVQADTGSIGGHISHEFHVLAEAGEDQIAFSTDSDYAANVELAQTVAPTLARPAGKLSLTNVSTPDVQSIEQVCQFLNVAASQTVKTLLVKGCTTDVVALLLRGDHQLNEIKAEKLPDVHQPLTFATESEVKAVVNCSAGSIGPVGLSIPIIADHSLINLADFVCGANQDDQHLTGVNWVRDLPEPSFADLRNVVEGDASPDKQGTLKICRGIEVGHIFQLGTKYSQAMDASVLDENGKSTIVTMGCYGIGISRIVAAAVEQNFDDKGIIWTDSLAPFDLILLPMNMYKSEKVRTTAEALYTQLQEHGYEVLFDDRKERAGVMFADAELIGIVHRLTIGDKSLANGYIDYLNRRTMQSEPIAIDQLMDFVKQTIKRE